MVKWNPAKILDLPIPAASEHSPGLVAAVGEERDGGW
jgi:hypothetical protein